MDCSYILKPRQIFGIAEVCYYQSDSRQRINIVVEKGSPFDKERQSSAQNKLQDFHMYSEKI